MELNSEWSTAPSSKLPLAEQAAYIFGAQAMLNAVEAMLNNMLKDLYTKEEKEGIKDVLKYLPVVKPLNTEQK